MQKLPRAFYARPTIIVAQDLLGTELVHRHGHTERIGRIVEVEAYLGPQDRASHSAKGRTPRNQSMFGPPGHAYVYLIYGIHYCLNVVTEPPGCGAAVLIRALEPVKNLSRRSHGPGLLTRALGIDRRHDGLDLLGDELFLRPGPTTEKFTVIRRPRVGVDYAGAWARRLLRFYISGNPHVSRR